MTLESPKFETTGQNGGSKQRKWFLQINEADKQRISLYIRLEESSDDGEEEEKGEVLAKVKFAIVDANGKKTEENCGTNTPSMPSGIFLEEHERCKGKAMGSFDELKKFGGMEMVGKFRAKLQKEIEAKRVEYERANEGKRKEEENARQAEATRRQEEANARQEEATRRQEEANRRQAEENARQAEETRRKEVENARQAEENRRREEEIRRRENEDKKIVKTVVAVVAGAAAVVGGVVTVIAVPGAAPLAIAATTKAIEILKDTI